MELWEKNLYALWSAQFIAVAGLSMVVPFFPFYLKELGVADPERVKIWSGLLFAAPFMVASFLQPIWGILGDRYGRKSMVIRGMVGMGLANILMGFARTAPQLLLLRLVQGSVAGFMAPSLALLSTCAPENKTGQALGTLQSSIVIGMTIGPLLGGLMAHFMGYRLIFFWTGSFCLAASAIVFFLAEENFVRKGREGQSRLRENIRYVFRSPDLRVILLFIIVVQFSIQIVNPFLSLYVELLRFPEAYLGLMTGFVFGVTGVTNALTAPFWGRRGDRMGYGKILTTCFLGMTLVYLPQAFVTDAFQLLILRAGLGVFVAGVMPTVNTLVQRHTAEKNRGGIYGIFQSGLLVGNMAGPLIGGILSAVFGLRAIFLITTGMIFLVLCGHRRMTSQNDRPSTGDRGAEAGEKA
jgi:DHA1 family multidrug resistance protein-like MFS transporter